MAEPIYTFESGSDTTGEERTSSAPQEIALGIDIGTSHIRVAVWNGHEVEVLENRWKQRSMECFLSFKNLGTVAGINSQVSLEQEMQSGSAILNVKRLIGRHDKDNIVHRCKSLPFLVQTLEIGVRPIIAALVGNTWVYTTPEEVLAILLLELKAMAEGQLNFPVRTAVLTVPVSFSHFQLSRVTRACAMAGLQVLRTMPEPTAVSLLYLQQQQQIAINENVMGGSSEKIVLIFNMGAGYCDVAVTVTAGGVSHMKAFAGSAVGGEDILINTMSYLIPDFDNLFSGHGINGIKLKACARVAVQNLIHTLSQTWSCAINLDLGSGCILSRTLERKVFEDVNQGVFERCKSLIKQCLIDARMRPEDLSDVILVGGCLSIPKIRNLVKSICKKEVLYEGIDPMEAAVCGAAVGGAVASRIHDPLGKLDLLAIQITPLSIGIRADGNNFVTVLPRNSIIPTTRETLFTTAHDNQTEALIVVYEGGESCLEDSHLLGYFKIGGIPPTARGIPEIRVCMDINSLNVLRVMAGVRLPESSQPVGSLMDVRMPNAENAHGWCSEALRNSHFSRLDLVSLKWSVS